MDAQNRSRLSTRLIVSTTIWFVLGAALLETFTQTVLPASGYFGYRQHISFNQLRVLTSILITDAVVMAAVAGVTWVIGRFHPGWVGLETLCGVLALAGFYGAIQPLPILSANAARILVLGLAVVVYRTVRQAPARWITFSQRSTFWLWAGTGVLLFAAYFGMGIAESIHNARTPQPAAGAPNVLLIVLDTFRADRTGAYGYGRGTTPFLDEFARHSIQYDKAFSTSSWTLPAHISAFTGREPSEHGAEVFSYDGRFETIAQALAQQGFQTVGISANVLCTTYGRGVGLGFLHYENTYLDWKASLEAATLAAFGARLLRRLGFTLESDVGWMRAEDVNRRFLDWVDHRPDRPFFAFLNYMDAHFPRRPPAEFARRFPGAAEPPRSSEWNRLVYFGDTPSPDMTRRVQDTYNGAVAYLDSQLRYLFDELKRRGLEKNLLVIITADHGESLGERGLYDHRTSLYLEQVRIPLFMSFAGRLPEGIHSNQPVSIRQVAATIAAFAGLEKGRFPGPQLPVDQRDDATPGESLGPTAELAGGQFAGVAPRPPTYQGRFRAVFSSNLHFILQEDGKMELFDWVQDPQELNNLVDSANPNLVKRFKEKLLHLPTTTSSHTSR